MLRSKNEFNLVIEADTPSQFRLRVPTGGDPDIIFLNMESYGWDEHALSQPLTYIHPTAKFLVTYMDLDVDQVINLIDKGASGFISMTDAPDDYKKAIDEVHIAGFYYNDLVSKTLVKRVNEKDKIYIEQWAKHVTVVQNQQKAQADLLKKNILQEILKINSRIDKDIFR